MDLDIVVTGVVGVAGIGAAYFSGRRQERNALAVVDKQILGAAEMAREERRQKRAESAYLELLSSTITLREWGTTMLTGAAGGPIGRVEPSTVPLHDLQYDPPLREGVLVAYWSPRVAQLVNDLRVAMGDLRKKAIYMETERASPGTFPDARGPDAVTTIFAVHDDLQIQVVRLRDHIAAELRGDATGEAVL